ncbi:putative non-specific serine/threonine protein kinase [Helianthus annuus]|nr:putative non-specific serine/threonine protein kinase [Helianthus annuus]
MLTLLSLNDNSLQGGIPNEIGRLIRLQELSLYNNSFTGNIPATITNCSNLQFLDLGLNNLVGKIPDGIGSLSMLRLALDGNILQAGFHPSSQILHCLIRFLSATVNLVEAFPTYSTG